MAKEKSAGIILKRNDKYLLLHYPGGHWDFPKGHLETGEDDKIAALRELKEETGLLAEFYEGFEHKLQYFLKREGHVVAKEVTLFLGKTKQQKVTLSEEHTGYEWLTFKDALNKITYDNSKEALKKAEKWLLENGKK